MSFARALPIAALLCLLVPAASHADQAKVAKKLKTRVILSQKPFPYRFKSDAAFVKHMKRADRKSFQYDEKDRIRLEFMAFFARPYQSTEFTVTVYDVTEKRELKDSFPIAPEQRQTQILSSFISLKKDDYDVERRIHMIVQPTYGGPIIAETTFAIKARPGEKPKDQP